MTINSISKMGLAFAVGVALSAGYVALGAQKAVEPKVVVVQERCDEGEERAVEAPEPSLPFGLAHDPPYYVVDQAELEAMARRCEVRDDVPKRLDDRIAAALGLSEDERRAWELAEARMTGTRAATEFTLLSEIDPDGDYASNEISAGLAKLHRTREGRARLEPEIHRAIAEERAGLREPMSPERLAKTDPWTRYERFRVSTGDRFAAELATGIGHARVEELRRKFGGWPGTGFRLISCAEESTVSSTVAGFTVEGELPRDIVRRVVRAHMGEVQECFDRSKLKLKLERKFVIEFEIDGDGNVGQVEFRTRLQFDESETRECMREAVQRWRFPKPREGTVKVSYPIVFSPN